MNCFKKNFVSQIILFLRLTEHLSAFVNLLNQALLRNKRYSKVPDRVVRSIELRHIDRISHVAVAQT